MNTIISQMKLFLSLLFCATLLLSCESERASTDATSVKEESAVESSTVPILKDPSVRDTFDCKIYGKVDRATDKWFAKEELYFAMTNDVFQKVQPEVVRYNVFQIYNTVSCELEYNGKLPNREQIVKPYRLQTDVYNSTTNLVCSQSADEVYCFHLGRREILNPLLPPMNPIKRGKVRKDQPFDLQSFQNYLFGWTESEGAYVFDMTDPINPIALTYIQTYSSTEFTNYYFLLDQDSGKQFFRCEILNDKIVLSKLFDEPLAIGGQLVREKPGGKFLIFKTLKDNKFKAFDFTQNKLISVPAETSESTISMKAHLNQL